MKTVLHYLRPRLGIMSVGLLIKFFGTVAELLLPWMLSVILDEAVPAGALGLWCSAQRRRWAAT